MRVISGTAKGRKLFSLEGDSTRPTSDRVKESIFNIIMPYIEGAKVLDLFAGSGALGIEALSRGASFAAFVDSSGRATEIIKRNLALTCDPQKSKVYKMDYFSFLKKSSESFDIVFLDPPYSEGYYETVLASLQSVGAVHKGSIVSVEESITSPAQLVAGFEVLTRRKYGNTGVTILITKDLTIS